MTNKERHGYTNSLLDNLDKQKNHKPRQTQLNIEINGQSVKRTNDKRVSKLSDKSVRQISKIKIEVRQ